jgi:hypothetical protein
MFYWEILSEVAKRFQNFNGGEEGFRAVMVEGGAASQLESGREEFFAVRLHSAGAHRGDGGWNVV